MSDDLLKKAKYEFTQLVKTTTSNTNSRNRQFFKSPVWNEAYVRSGFTTYIVIPLLYDQKHYLNGRKEISEISYATMYLNSSEEFVLEIIKIFPSLSSSADMFIGQVIVEDW